MSVDLHWGYPNHVGTGVVVVLAATTSTVRLGVNDGRGEVPAETYTNWETFEVDGVRWTIEAIYGMPATDGSGPPGTGAGQVVAVVNHESAGV